MSASAKNDVHWSIVYLGVMNQIHSCQLPQMNENQTGFYWKNMTYQKQQKNYNFSCFVQWWHASEIDGFSEWLTCFYSFCWLIKLDYMFNSLSKHSNLKKTAFEIWKTISSILFTCSKMGKEFHE